MKKGKRSLLRIIFSRTMLITLLLLIAAMYPTVEYFLGNTFHLPGQNYHTVTEMETTQP